MITVRRAADRGHFDHGWLDTWHTFSFADYHDPAHMGFRSLRVINDDRVQPGHGFPTHAHQDMEIVTYILEGALEHKDSLGTGSIIRPGEVQRMSAGTGVRHSEFNPSRGEGVHLLQIWILPERRGLQPSYEQKSFPESERRGRLRVVAARDGADGAVTIHQDARILLGALDGAPLTHDLAPGRHAWVQVTRGNATVNDTTLAEADGAAVSNERRLTISGDRGSEVMLFDLA
jgi:quercetin 2,3-dioxygenase